MPAERQPLHLGDGLYVVLEGHQLRLTANHHDPEQATDTVYVEPAVWLRLCGYVSSLDGTMEPSESTARRWLRRGRQRWGRFSELNRQLEDSGWHALAAWLRAAP